MTDTAQTHPAKTQQDLNEVLLSWKSPSHPFRKKNTIFYQTVAGITFLCVVIVFFLHEFILIGVILSIAFVVYAITSVPPVEVEHKVMPVGFENAGRVFRWQELYVFWLEKKWGYTMIVFQTRLPFPGKISAVLSPEMAEEQVKKTVGKYLLFLDKPLKSVTDHFSDWLSNKIPLDAPA